MVQWTRSLPISLTGRLLNTHTHTYTHTLIHTRTPKRSPDCAACSWTRERRDWADLVLPALCYLTGEVGGKFGGKMRKGGKRREWGRVRRGGRREREGEGGGKRRGGRRERGKGR